MTMAPIAVEDLEILLPEKDIQAEVKALAGRVASAYEGRPLLLVGVLKGAWVFLADLVRHIPFNVDVDFIKVSSYGNATDSSGEVKFEMDFSHSIQGKDVLIVEDIVDSGLTLKYLKKNLLTRKPASVRVCALLDKPERHQTDVEIDYRGFEIPDRFVVGYGLDCAGFFRNLPSVAALTPEQSSALVQARR